MDGDSTQVTLRHKTLYFMDGNVVLLTQRADDSALLFRVHKSVLSSHSPIFADMFEICNPSGSTSENEEDTSENKVNDIYDGVPLVRLSDNSDHIGSVLEVLYYQSDLPCMPRNPDYPVLITPILDLSRKYGIDRMYERIVKQFECDWPRTLKDWDNFEREIEYRASDSDVKRLDDYSPEPAAAIKLSREFHIPSILPAAFYHLSRLSILDDWDKTHLDPSILIRNPTKRTARWGQLSAKEFHCLLLGKANFADFLRGCINTKDLRHTINAANGWGGESCEVGKELWNEILDRCLQSQSPDPLGMLKNPIKEDKAKRCSACTKTLKAKIVVVRAQIWERLGDLFHLKDLV